MKTKRSAFITEDCRLDPYGESASRPDTFKSLVLCLLITCVTQPIVATAQITLISPGASVEKAANGVTLIQIPTPSAAGVSHLLYDEFNSPPAGMVFNNSRVVVQ
jgi:hypothetical protein